MSNPALMLLIAMALGYLVGAIPLADLLSRRQGVDIFSTGTGLAGASNVLKNVGRWAALFVLAGDIAKGVVAVAVGEKLGVSGPWILLPAATAIAGHWNSVFTGFRGGDGLGTLGGVTLVVFPVYGVVAVSIGMLVALGGQKMPYSSLMSIVCGYIVLALFSLADYGEMINVLLGFGGLAAVVLAHAALGHRRRRRGAEWTDMGEASSIVE